MHDWLCITVWHEVAVHCQQGHSSTWPVTGRGHVVMAALWPAVNTDKNTYIIIILNIIYTLTLIPSML